MKNKRMQTFDIVNLAFITLLCIVMFYPFYNIIITSFANYGSLLKSSAYVLPFSFQLDNYGVILTDAGFFKGVMVTTFITIVGTALCMLVSIFCAYALSHKGLPGRNVIISLIMFTMFFSGGLIPYYLTIKSLDLVDTIWVMILPVTVSSFYVFIMKSYFLTIPASLAESAKIDGANDLQILFKIIIPVSKPIIATFCLFYAVDRWNEWWYGLLFINNPDIRPLQLVLREILLNTNTMVEEQAKMYAKLTNPNVFSIGIQAAAIVLTVLPVIAFYPFLQKYFVKGIMIGSMKE